MEDKLIFHDCNYYSLPNEIVGKKLVNCTIDFVDISSETNPNNIKFNCEGSCGFENSLFELMYVNKCFTNYIDICPHKIHLNDVVIFNIYILNKYNIRQYCGEIIINYDDVCDINKDDKMLYVYHIYPLFSFVDSLIFSQKSIAFTLLISTYVEDITKLEITFDEYVIKQKYIIENYMDNLILIIPLHDEITKKNLKYIKNIELPESRTIKEIMEIDKIYKTKYHDLSLKFNIYDNNKLVEIDHINFVYLKIY
jgi:hypothetical protein